MNPISESPAKRGCFESSLDTKERAARRIQKACRAFLQRKALSLLAFVEPGIDQEPSVSIRPIDPRRLPLDLREYTSLFSRVMTLQQAMRTTHFTFTHAVTANVAFYQDITTTLLTRRRTASLNRFFRLDREELPRLHEHALQNISLVIDNHLEGALISCDGYHFNTDEEESALNYFLVGVNECNEEKLFESIQAYIENNIAPNAELTGYLIEEIADLHEALCETIESSRRLYLFAISKTVLENEDRNYVYRSHSLGLPCYCREIDATNSHRGFLSFLKQNNQGFSRTCEHGEFPQYRIFTKPFEEDKSKKVFPFDLMNQEAKKNYRAALARIKRFALHFRSIREAIELENRERLETCKEFIDPRIKDSLYVEGMKRAFSSLNP